MVEIGLTDAKTALKRPSGAPKTSQRQPHNAPKAIFKNPNGSFAKDSGEQARPKRVLRVVRKPSVVDPEAPKSPQEPPKGAQESHKALSKPSLDRKR